MSQVFLTGQSIQNIIFEPSFEYPIPYFMKKELGDWTRRLSLCFLFSSSAGAYKQIRLSNNVWSNKWWIVVRNDYLITSS